MKINQIFDIIDKDTFGAKWMNISYRVGTENKFIVKDTVGIYHECEELVVAERPLFNPYMSFLVIKRSDFSYQSYQMGWRRLGLFTPHISADGKKIILI